MDGPLLRMALRDKGSDYPLNRLFPLGAPSALGRWSDSMLLAQSGESPWHDRFGRAWMRGVRETRMSPKSRLVATLLPAGQEFMKRRI